MTKWAGQGRPVKPAVRTLPAARPSCLPLPTVGTDVGGQPASGDARSAQVPTAWGRHEQVGVRIEVAKGK